MGFISQVDRFSQYKPRHIGLALSNELSIVFIDMDDVYDPVTKIIEDWAKEIIETVNSYTEFSQSGKGVHIYAKGMKTTSKCRKGKLEVYDHNRFAVITNTPYGSPISIREATKEIDVICKKFLDAEENTSIHHENGLSPEMTDDEVIERASTAKNGEKFTRLFEGDLSDYQGDDSAADLALMHLLVFWTQNYEQLERVFSHSELGKRGKWIIPFVNENFDSQNFLLTA